MSIYTYGINKNLSEILNIEYDENEFLSDQELEKIPNGDEKFNNWQFTNKGGTISEDHKIAISKKLKGRVAWNRGLQNPTAAANGKKGSKKMSEIAKGRKRSYLPDGSWTWVYPQK